jgi:hypothetical protein
MSVIESRKDGNLLTFDEVKHQYRLNGIRVPGPTTFGKGGYPTSEMLIGWMIGQGSRFTADQIMKVATTDQGIGRIEEKWLKEIIKESKTAYRTSSMAAAAIGTVVHDYAYHTELGHTEEAEKLLALHRPTEAWAKISNGIDKFKEWKGQNTDEIVATEAIVASVQENYGGKFDRLAYRPGTGLILSDFKTSSGIFVDMFIQLGAYVKAIDEFQTLLITDKSEIEEFIRQAIFCRRTYSFRLKWESDKRFKWMGRAS